MNGNQQKENSEIPCRCGRSPTGFCTGMHKLTNEQYQVATRLNEQKTLLTEEVKQNM